MKKIVALAAACACMPALVLSVPPSAVAKTAATPKVSRQDVAWLKTSIQTDRAEIQGGKLAARKSSNRAVLNLARTLITDHTTLLKAAEKVARRYEIGNSTSPSSKQIAQTAAVATKTGRTFNIDYSSMEIAGHKKSIAQTKTELAKGSNRSIKAAARTALPMLEMHLRLAEAALKASR